METILTVFLGMAIAALIIAFLAMVAVGAVMVHDEYVEYRKKHPVSLFDKLETRWERRNIHYKFS